MVMDIWVNIHMEEYMYNVSRDTLEQQLNTLVRDSKGYAAPHDRRQPSRACMGTWDGRRARAKKSPVCTSG